MRLRSREREEEQQMPLAERTASIVWRGDLRGGSGRLSVGSGAVPEQDVTFSARTEDSNGMTSPEELIAAAHATCYAMAFSNTLANDGGTAPERLEVTAKCGLERTSAGLKVTTMDLDVRGEVPGMSGDRFAELAKTAEQRCPVSNALRNNVEIRVHPQLVGVA
jgi:osmotically inducible protein OsmC